MIYVHVINQKFYYHQNFKELKMNSIELLTKLNIQNHLIDHYYLNNKVQFILPKFINNKSFKKLHSIILYSAALTIIRLNGSEEIDQTNNIKTKELPKWEQRLNTHINNIRRDLGRITQYLKGINSNHLNNCINRF
jgi:hypothetical protein